MNNIIEFTKRKPRDIQPYIDFDKGWKFTEEDKEFLVKYCEDWIKVCIEEADGDNVEDYQQMLDSIKEKGVNASKNLIQIDARMLAEAVGYDIYEYYNGDTEFLKYIEKSILTVQW